jgi:hypothetical protein
MESTKLPKPSAMQTLLLHKEKNEIYAVGGLQCIPMTQFEDVESEYCMGTFSVMRDDAWIVLPQPEDTLCVPTCYIMNSKIYAAGGFMHPQDGIQKYKDIQVYDILTNSWLKLNAKFDISIIGAIAKPMPGDNVLLLGGKINLEVASNRIHLLKNGSAVDTKEVAALELVTPCFEGEGRLFVFTENYELLVLNLANLSSQVINVQQYIRPGNDLSLVAKTFRPPDRKRFCYHYNAIEGEMYEMNVQTLTKEAYNMQPPKLRDIGICHLNDGHLLLVGGVAVETEYMQEHTASDKCFIFDCLVKAQFVFPSLLKPQHGCRVLQINNQIFALAGKSQDLTISCNQVYDLTSQKWSMLPKSPLSVWYPAVAALKDMIYTIGGETAMDECSNLIQELNPVSRTWSQLDVVFPIQAKKISAFSIDNDIFIFGGEGGDAEAIESWYKFNGQEVREAGRFVSDDVLEFNDPPCITAEMVCLFSLSGRNYILNLGTNEWGEPDVEEVTEEVINRL